MIGPSIHREVPVELTTDKFLVQIYFQAGEVRFYRWKVEYKQLVPQRDAFCILKKADFTKYPDELRGIIEGLKAMLPESGRRER